MQLETLSASRTRCLDPRKWLRGIVPLVALLSMACSGSSTERSRTDAGATVEAETPASTAGAASSSTSSTPPASSSSPAAAAPATTPASPQPATTPGPNITYGILDTNLKDEEVPIRWTPVFTGTPQTRLEGDVLWAPAPEIARVLSPNARVTFEGGQLRVDGKTVAARTRLENGVVWAEVVPLARHFGALGRVRPEDRSVVIIPRDALLWLRDHGDPQSPAVVEAKAAGLLDG